MLRLVLLILHMAALMAATGCSSLQETVMVKGGKPVHLLQEDDFPGMVVHFLGISEGEATLIRFPDGYTMLVDTGSAASGKELAEILEQNRIQRIDTLVLTGEMDGHVGGVNEILRRFPVEQLMLPVLTKDSILDEVSDVPAHSIIGVQEGQTYDFPLGTKMRILHPDEPLSLSPQANSLVFQLVHGKVKFLFMSDVNEEIEHELLEKYSVKSQILKVSDSGSNQASSQQFLEKVDAHAAIIFHDDGKVPGFDEVLERLSETWMDVYQTKNHGTISVFSDGKDYRIEREKIKGYFDAR